MRSLFKTMFVTVSTLLFAYACSPHAEAAAASGQAGAESTTALCHGEVDGSLVATEKEDFEAMELDGLRITADTIRLQSARTGTEHSPAGAEIEAIASGDSEHTKCYVLIRCGEDEEWTAYELTAAGENNGVTNYFLGNDPWNIYGVPDYFQFKLVRMSTAGPPVMSQDDNGGSYYEKYRGEDLIGGGVCLTAATFKKHRIGDLYYVEAEGWIDIPSSAYRHDVGFTCSIDGGASWRDFPATKTGSYNGVDSYYFQTGVLAMGYASAPSTEILYAAYSDQMKGSKVVEEYLDDNLGNYYLWSYGE